MSETIQFQFRNDQPIAVELVIEPWAHVENIPSGSVVTFEVNAEPSPEIEFSITENNRPYIYVMSEAVTIRIDGSVKYKYTTEARPPKDVFNILRKNLWPS